ncbi:signal peptidase I, partial [uncultured Brevundimonas sp.]|uniref:signal peptidase I n=1 Tax=uncultured Brevundimonas sp. TaxID=213418 RepID=UPI0025D219C5
MTQTPLKAPPRPSLLREVREIALTLLFAIILALAIRIVLFQPFTIPSSSMEPGLVTGDYIVVSKYPYGWSTASLPFNPAMSPGRLFGREPRRGDVVVFRLPRDPSEAWIKRVVGLPG